MREILFRGKREDDGVWICGMPCATEQSGIYALQTMQGGIFDIIPETLGQYTGLTAKNGMDIFEGDIVTMPSYGGGRHKSVVYFKKGKFAVDGSNYSFKDIAPKNMEVIGNIHDNPELLNPSFKPEYRDGDPDCPICPNCRTPLNEMEDCDCGQKIDWSEE